MHTSTCLICLLICGLFNMNFAYLKLFNTENALNVQSYDCIYYANVTARNNETTPYCIRSNETGTLKRSFPTKACENSGKEFTLKSLKEMNVSQDDVLKWNSSIEMVDRYAAYITTGHEQFAYEKICNCSLGTFGKFCEYKFMTMNTFEDTIAYQFHLKKKYRHGSQLWSNMTCYITLTSCYSGLRCLTWQEICNGKQECMEGLDEDNCKDLEYNECGENEYRCRDGSCISEQYWLDGVYDCSDKSDEQEISENHEDSRQCSTISSQFNCDETIADDKHLSCGDGEFLRSTWYLSNNCYNYRMNMFFCEFAWSIDEYGSMWTLENGHCVDDGWIERNFTDMDEREKCVFYLKCKLTNGKNVGCKTAIDSFHLLCNDKQINYPSAPFFRPYVQTVYQVDEAYYLSDPHYVYYNGSIKCIGYKAFSDPDENLINWLIPTEYVDFESYFCNISQPTNSSTAYFDMICRSQTNQSFFCETSRRCISRYRIKDVYIDCRFQEDETTVEEYQPKQKYRLNCFRGTLTYLLVSAIGNGWDECQNGDDEYLTLLQWKLVDYKCTVYSPSKCTVIRTYIQSPSTILAMANSKIQFFRQYCDTLWQQPNGFDESTCNEWMCSKDHYQCLSGHCIPIDYMIDKRQINWQCPDASDKLGFFKAMNVSTHNARFANLFESYDMKHHFIQYSRFYTGFSKFCKETEEYGCILAGVGEPLNFTLNRPCINLTQIGDGIIDCYGGLDERNVLSCGNNILQQRGFDFHCSNQECILYNSQCKQRCSNEADNLLCSEIPTLTNSICIDLPRYAMCEVSVTDDCHLSDIDKYYCDSGRITFGKIPVPYRSDTWSKVTTSIYLPVYPDVQNVILFNITEMQHSDSCAECSFVFQKEESDGKEGWICGRGVAIKSSNKDSGIQCFCPPSLYGEYCQYFSDRITIVVSLYDIPSELLKQQSDTIKILALLLSDDEVIDQYTCHLSLLFSNGLNKKLRFNLVHSRPKNVSTSYSVRFEAYHLTSNSPIKFIGIWEYPIYFPFLPSYRLAQVLKFEKQNASLVNLHICRTANPCRHNSTCHPIMNKIINIFAYYCYCKSNSFGKNCEYLASSPSTSCSKHASLRSLSFFKSICLCLTDLYGPTCHINHTCVYKNPCGIDRGKCYTNPDNITHDYICICDKKFFGDHCELDSAVVTINFTDFSFIETPLKFIMSSIFQLCDLDNETLDLIVREKRVYQGLPPPVIEVFHNNHYLPTLGILKVYHKHHLSNDYVANLKQSKYFILYITLSKVSRMNITSIVNKTNYCPNTAIVFHKNLSDISYLFQTSEVDSNHVFNTSVLVFKYHLLCNPPCSLLCFHDDNYFCLCDMYSRAECSRYDSTLDECDGRCRAGGQCIHGNLDDRRDFLCLCPRCYYGSICQHNTQLFSFTLETLLTNDLNSSSIFIQQLFSNLLIIIPAILFLIGIVNNICCYVTFNRKKPLLVGIGHYLRTVSIVNQLALLLLLLKLIHIVLSIKGYIVHQLMNIILCKVLSYLLSCTSRMSYWLTGMVAIERVYVTWYLRGAWLKSPRVAKRIMKSIIIGIVICNIHEVIFYQSIEDPKSSDLNNSTWCVTSYPSIINKYNQINIILNYIMPFLINILSTIILMVLIIQKRVTAITKKNDRTSSPTNIRLKLRLYIDLLAENKELILAPLITMLPQLFSLPQFILSFTLACQEFRVSWQRYLLIVAYFTTYVPQAFSYKLYISPSTFYKTQFNAAKLGKMFIIWCPLVIKNKPTVSSPILRRAINKTVTRTQYETTDYR